MPHLTEIPLPACGRGEGSGLGTVLELALFAPERWRLHRGGGEHLRVLRQRPAPLDPRESLPPAVLFHLRRGQQQSGLCHGSVGVLSIIHGGFYPSEPLRLPGIGAW